MRTLQLVLFFILVLSFGACSSKQDAPIPAQPGMAHVASAFGPQEIQVREGEAELIRLSNHATILVEKRAGQIFHTVEGTLSERAYHAVMAAVSTLPAEKRQQALDREIDLLLGELGQYSAIGLKKYPELGYFVFRIPYTPEVLSVLKGKTFSQELLISPVVTDPDVVKNIKAITPAAEGLRAKAPGRGGMKDFSGLERMHAPEFIKIAEADIGNGAKVDGSSVRLGITDTGITYNHRTFLAQDRKASRIIYMRDFTREGRIYFNEAAKFQAAPVEGTPDVLALNAEVIVTPNLPSLPAGDSFTPISALNIRVSPELKAELLKPGTKARLGVLTELSLSAAAPDGEKSDVNGNGKIDDIFPVLLIPGETAEASKLFIDFSAEGDFAALKPLRSWNSSGEMLEVFAEKIGFDIQDDFLPSADGKSKIAVKSASIVGYDPGNHGSHVAGIAAGRKTIANDSEDTLARGVAPAANILMNRVCSNNAGCEATEAIIDMALNGGAEVINMSLGGLNPFNDGFGVQETLINRITSLKSVLFVISAGNSGPGRQTVGSPSVARLSLSVGAAATKGLIQRQYQWPGAGASRSEDLDSDFMLFFSSRGPTAAGGFKPNVAAPGTELSSIQLNAAPGARGGLDVYWGTSMAAPAAAGAYALLLDAVKKYNAAHPEKALPRDAVTLRQVIIQSARAFDVNSYDPETGATRSGQYTWIDQGMGMVDLVAAWKKLQEVRDQALPITEDDVPVDLDYQVVVPMKSPSGVAYDGTRMAFPPVPGLGLNQPTPAFGTGLYLDIRDTESLKAVYIERKLPEALLSTPVAGELTRRLLDTYDEFVLKTTIYGSNKVWLKAGILNELDCWNSETANLMVIGRGVDIAVGPQGATINPFMATRLNVCLNREMIATELAPGDHGALISAYRVVNGKTAALPSFVVPVSVTVPNQTLVRSNALEIDSKVKSFGVSRHYVMVPAGTTALQLTLEVPPLKTTPSGAIAQGEKCSGVELMALKGGNTSGVYKTRKEARVSNCDANGAPVENPAKRKIVYSEMNPKPGLWDLHVFGQYAYTESGYKIRVDYVNSASDVKKISGDVSALSGSLNWILKDASIPAAPDLEKSRYFLNGLFAEVKSNVQNGQIAPIPGSRGDFRVYPPEAKQVTITTGGAPGNDIDLLVLECKPESVLPGAKPECNPLAQSGGSTDEESASFVPKPEKAYLAIVNGYSIKNGGDFVSTETVRFAPEAGRLAMEAQGPTTRIRYELTMADLQKGTLVSSDLFKSGGYELVGAIELRMSNQVLLDIIPVSIKAAAPSAN